MSTIAFNAADPLNQQQLGNLEKAKSHPSNLVVVNARRDPTDGRKLLIDLSGELSAARLTGPTLPPPNPSNPLSKGMEASLRKTVWNLKTSPSKTSTAKAGNAPEVRLLCIHGVGHGDVDANLEPSWSAGLTAQLQAANPTLQPVFHFLKYDDLFDHAPHNVLTYAEAFLRMGWSGVSSFFEDLFTRRGGLTETSDALRWTAGMVAQWGENDDLRHETRRRVADAIETFLPDIVVAHSLGTLISYDTFSRIKDDSGHAWNGPDLIKGRFYITMGSQIGSRFTRRALGGRIKAITARHWFHLYNKHDDAFTAPLKITAPNFDQLLTTFDLAGMLDHDANHYIHHRIAAEGCWRSIALATPEPAAQRGTTRGVRKTEFEKIAEAEQAHRDSVLRPVLRHAPRRRALLIGINDYPNPADRLEGCVNDVFLMSSLLQEGGFQPEDIRVVLNERATAKGILERLEWLLDGSGDGMERVFYYSGHGAQIPGYGVGEKVDRKDECLVSYDFDWSRERAVTDDQFYELYSQLPYNTKFCAIFDCCHSGGIARDGGLKVRGLTPPDDIRHRALRWDETVEMWVPRDFGKTLEKEVSQEEDPAKRRKTLIRDRRKHTSFFGEGGDEHRLFRAAALRPADELFDHARKVYDHYGPFLPFILQACEEQQYSYEYRHGVTSYGAFTYSLAQYVRRKRREEQALIWQTMVKEVGQHLHRLRYDQSPCLICPKVLRNDPVPWRAESKKGRPARPKT